MKLGCKNLGFEYEFKHIKLEFQGKPYENIFGQKNNKTVAETLKHHRYAILKLKAENRYSESLDKPLGTFLLELKKGGDSFYTHFLNKYGDLKYSKFVISDSTFLDSKGIYAYLVGDDLKYIGRCKDSMKKRVNQGYGKIHPKNCYLDGQATNCHLNSRITQIQDNVSLWLCPINTISKIEIQEKELIRTYNPPWNIQRG